MNRDDMETFYRRYNACCNAHDFDALDTFVSPGVQINGAPANIHRYQDNLREVIAAFPDCHWNIEHLLVDAPWIAVRLTQTGTHRGDFLGMPATGHAFSVMEFAFYRIESGMIAEVWGTADNVETLRQLRATGSGTRERVTQQLSERDSLHPLVGRSAFAQRADAGCPPRVTSRTLTRQ